MHSILYLRYSTPEQADGQSEKRQVEYAKKWSRENGAQLVRVYKDLGVSGGKKAGTSKNERKGLADARLTFNQIANDKLQDMVDSNFKLYKQITDNAEFAQDLLSWMFERYLRAKRPDRGDGQPP